MGKVDNKQDFLNLCQAARKNTAAEALGIEIIDGDRSQIVATMPITNSARQPLGMLHGGVNMVLAETVASLRDSEILIFSRWPVVCMDSSRNAVF